MNNVEIPIAVTIIDDEDFEMDEQFIGLLSTADSDVTLNPNETTVRVLDDDGIVTMCIAYTMVYSCSPYNACSHYICLPSANLHPYGECWQCNGVCRQKWYHQSNSRHDNNWKYVILQCFVIFVIVYRDSSQD